MIRVTVELLPLASEKHKEHLGTIEIANLGTGSKSIGNYRYMLSKKGNPTTRYLAGIVEGFPRKLSAYHLLRLVLEDALGD